MSQFHMQPRLYFTLSLMMGVILALSLTTQAQTQPSSSSPKAEITSAPAVSEHLLRWYGFRVYVVRLEVPARGVDPMSDVKKSMTITYERAFSAKDITGAARKLLGRTPSVNLASLTSRLDQLDVAYRDVVPGDRYTLDYTPGVGLTLLLNDKALVTIPGADFAMAYYGMWLGTEDPISSSLREHLLEGIGVDPSN